MGRETEFRWWHKKYKRMFCDVWDFEDFINENEFHGKYQNDEHFELDERLTSNYSELYDEFCIKEKYGCIPMQFTGLCDGTQWDELTQAQQEEWLDNGYRNEKDEWIYNTKDDWHGKKIFEGDILHLDKNIITASSYDIPVIFERGQFIAQGAYTIEPIDFIYCKVIGNIYANPELLENNR